MDESDKFWEIMAAVVPVLALAFVLEMRVVRFHRMGPFSRLRMALTHAFTILILLASEAAALMHLQGARQAPWAESVALYGCLAALSVILVTPTSRLLIIAFYGTSPADYVSYWKLWRRLRGVRRRLKAHKRRIWEGHRKLQRIDDLVAKHEGKAGGDIHSTRQKENNRSQITKLVAERGDLSRELTAVENETKDLEKEIRKLDQKLVKQAGLRTKLIMKAFDENSA